MVHFLQNTASVLLLNKVLKTFNFALYGDTLVANQGHKQASSATLVTLYHHTGMGQAQREPDGSTFP